MCQTVEGVGMFASVMRGRIAVIAHLYLSAHGGSGYSAYVISVDPHSSPVI